MRSLRGAPERYAESCPGRHPEGAALPGSTGSVPSVLTADRFGLKLRSVGAYATAQRFHRRRPRGRRGESAIEARKSSVAQRTMVAPEGMS